MLENQTQLGRRPLKNILLASVNDPFLVNSTQLDQTNYYVNAIGTSLNTSRFSTDGRLAHKICIKDIFEIFQALIKHREMSDLVLFLRNTMLFYLLIKPISLPHIYAVFISVSTLAYFIY